MPSSICSIPSRKVIVEPFTEKLLLEIDRPVSGIDERAPACVLGVPQLDGHQWAPLGADRFLDEFHVGLSGSAPSFTNIAFHTGTNDIFPGGLATEATWHDVVDAQFARDE